MLTCYLMNSLCIILYCRSLKRKAVIMKKGQGRNRLGDVEIVMDVTPSLIVENVTSAR